MSDPLAPYGLRPIELADRARMSASFAALATPLSDYSFSQLFTWRNSLRIAWRELAGHVCVFANGTGDLTLLMPPLGDTGADRALTAAFELMDDYNAAAGAPRRSCVEYVSEELLGRFNSARFLAEPMGFDYLYDVNRMIDLAGGDLASKRQAKNRFQRLYEHRVETFVPAQHAEECLALLESWRVRQDAQDDAADPASQTLKLKRLKESRAAEMCIEHAAALDLRGMVVRVRGPDGQFAIKGFTFGEPLGADQCNITVEKTDLETRGLAQFIFSEFCRTCWAKCPLVNAGDDWGLPTLAWTKRSYRPVKLLNKYVLRRAVMTQVAVHCGAGVPPALVTVDEIGRERSDFPHAAAAPMPVAASPAPPPPRIRPAGIEDLPAAAALEDRTFDAGVRLKPRQLRYLQQRETSIVMVAEDNGQIVGSVVGLLRRHKGLPSGRLYSLAVRDDRRGQGIGRQLLQAILDALAARGVQRIYLEVAATNAPAIHLYERHGFTRVGDLADYYGPGQSAVHMMRQAPMPQSRAG